METTVRDYIRSMQKHKMTDEEVKWLFSSDKKSYRFNRGVITNDYYLAKQIFERDFKKHHEYVVKYIVSKSQMEIIYENGERMVWVKANRNSRGCKLHGAYIDENIDLEIFNMIIKPCFLSYEGSQIKILQEELDEN